MWERCGDGDISLTGVAEECCICVLKVGEESDPLTGIVKEYD